MNTPQAGTAIDETLKTEAQAKAAADTKAQWLQYFNRAASSPAGLGAISIPPCQPIIGRWFRQGDLGFISGPRGLGKTWLAMVLARKCAEGSSFGGLPEWQIHGQRRVLYVDGEMAMDGIRERDNALAAAPTQGIIYLQHEALFHLTGKVLNLTEPEAQAALLEKCRQDKIDILFLDNLSCLFSGMRENDADAWERVLPWLLDLRRNRIAVIFVAHSGRNGMMRGTSRREDAAFWIIDLSDVKDAGENRHGAKFIARFVKNRNTIDADCPEMEWTFVKPPGHTSAAVSWKKIVAPDRFRQCIDDGLLTASQIAEEMCLSRGQVSKYATKAIKEGWLVKKGREYAFTPKPSAHEVAKECLKKMLRA
ncbi:MAG TPA: AAA family ATPase [Verrucomicrobiae bacterium]|jgi:putative DNA primase/helicase